MAILNLKFLKSADSATKAAIADIVFPGIENKLKALYRVINGDGMLSADQAYALAQYLGVTMEDLYSKEGFTMVSSGTKIRLVSEEYTAILNTTTMQTQIFEGSTDWSKKGFEVAIHSEGITLTEYLKLLNAAIFRIKAERSTK